MGKGGAITPGAGENAQMPRLTSMLRGLSRSTAGALPSLEQLYAQRSRQLQDRRQTHADIGGAHNLAARTQLVAVTLRSWSAAPKAARADFDKYMRAVSKLTGSEATPEEVAATACAAWDALAQVPPPSEDDIRRRGAAAAAMRLAAPALQAALGYAPDPGSVTAVMAAHGALRTWQQQLGGGGNASAPHAALIKGKGKGPASAPHPPAAAQPAARMSVEQAVLATCGVGADEPAALVLQLRQGPDQLAAPQLEMRRGPTAGVSQEEATAVEVEVFGLKGRELNRDAGARWLTRWCATVTGGAASALGGDDTVPTAVARLLLSPRSDDELAAELFDLLGERVFDGIEELLNQRPSLAANIRAAVAALRSGEEAAEKSAAGGGGSGPSYGPSVTVTSESEKLILKMERKAERRRGKRAGGGGGGFDADAGDADLVWLGRHGLGGVVEEEEDQEEDAMRIRLGDGAEFRLGAGDRSRVGLPKGTTRRAFKGYEEVAVPAVRPAPAPEGERVVHIVELPGWAQLAFGGYEKLNRIQSRIFPTAFGSNENMLVCAPTGAGKTNIAMIAVLREVGQHMRGTTIQRNDFKIVYVAPMKALAAEVTASFSKRLQPLGLSVRELTGDMQLSKKEMGETQMIVTTPEKWDVITRKGGEVSVAASVKLLIIDEVHLLNDERGAVLETLVARTTRQVETTQSMIRIVGLSATLPNYRDVGTFLGVNPDTGLFYFDASYRPVPLATWFVGVSEKNFFARQAIMDEVCYQKVAESLRRGHQAMVFVHSRKDTGKTARMLALKAQQYGEAALFDCTEEPGFPIAAKDAKKSRNRELAEVFDSGLGIHHAGMLRPDRNLAERCFGQGLIKVLCCTATLAWGVNLPAHTVIIKGTQLYNPQKGGFTDLGNLDVQQIFGRAGRPQFQDEGEGVIITTHDKLAHYLSMLTHQVPIESRFIDGLVDHLNAEIVLGTVTNVREASLWLSYTYLYVRMTQNPLPYGITWATVAGDPTLEGHRRKLITDAARELERARMARFDERSGNIYVTELGRVASHFYIRQTSIETFNSLLKPHMNEADVLSMIAQSSEFDNLAIREEELPELDTLAKSDACPFETRGGSENKSGKANILLQAFVSRCRMESFSLSGDMNYVSSNAPRIARALFEICLRRGWPSAADLCLTVGKALERRLWPQQHLLWQFEGAPLRAELLRKLEDRDFDLYTLADMSAGDIGAALRYPAAGDQIAACVASFPAISIQAHLHPITRTVLRLQLDLEPTFTWNDRVHGAALRWLVWVEDSDNEKMYHSEVWTLTKRMWKEGPQRLAFTVPIFEPLPPQYYIRLVSDSWLGAESTLAVSFRGLILPERHPPHTELLDLDPLPLSALGNPQYEALYRFSHFNPIQTQAFHVLYHSDESVLLGAPTGSGKTISAELAMLRLFTAHPGAKAVYIAPLKALVRERMRDWGTGLCRVLGKRLVELTGDVTPDLRALLAADVIIATPEKWDGISRGWQGRAYVRQVGLIVMDEIHLLGADRGPVLEVIVSRMRYVAAQTAAPVRFLGLSTALANAGDLASWLGVGPKGLFNFKPSVRPVPLECHIQGYPGKFYCPRMATMNKPAYAAIQTHSPTKPVLVFVSSRRQTRLTALDLIAYAAADDRPRTFLRMADVEIEALLGGVRDGSLRHTLQFGVGLHHAGLAEEDRALVERLFVEGHIQVLVATSTLAWGVNTPTHLVVIKGTEFYDAPTKRYVDYPITDVLQMMGRAGRPQYDRHGVAVIMVHEPKKSFYKKFLYEPFPVESSLPAQLADHLNAEVVGGTVTSRQEALDYLTWTFFMRRLLQNPSYYDLDTTEAEGVSAFLSGLVGSTLRTLEAAGCLALCEDGGVTPLTPGRIASTFYLRHATMAVFAQQLGPGMGVQGVLGVLCGAAEYQELPVRHNEDRLNAALGQEVRWAPDSKTLEDPHTKASLLLQAHLGRLPLPISDYITDTRSVLDNSLRVLQALIDVAADAGWLGTALAAMGLVQALMQGRWHDDSPLLTLPHASAMGVARLAAAGVGSLREVLHLHRIDRSRAAAALEAALGRQEAQEAAAVLDRLPLLQMRLGVQAAAAKRAQRAAGEGSSSGSAAHPQAEAQSGGGACPSDEGASFGGGSEPQLLLEVELTRLHGRSGRSGGAPQACAPRFPKMKEEGWWVVVGVAPTQELLALKRVSFGQRTTVRLALPARTTSGPIREVEVRLVCDSYLGLDLVQTVPLQAGAGRLFELQNPSLPGGGNNQQQGSGRGGPVRSRQGRGRGGGARQGGQGGHPLGAEQTQRCDEQI